MTAINIMTVFMTVSIVSTFIPNTAHAKLAKCVKLGDEGYQVFVPETDVPKYIAFDHKCGPAFSDSETPIEPISPLQPLPLKLKPTQQSKTPTNLTDLNRLKSNPKNKDASHSIDILDEINSFFGFNSLSNDECLKKIKENHAIATNKTSSCYNVFRYIQALAASENKTSNKEKPILTNSSRPPVSEKFNEVPSCSYLRDLNFAILASSSKITFEKLRTLRQNYTKKLYHTDYVEKLRLNDELAKQIEASFLLRGKAICYLGITNKVGQKSHSDSTTISQVKNKVNGNYYFSEDIFRQIDAITTARDIASGRSIDRSPRGYPAD